MHSSVKNPPHRYGFDWFISEENLGSAKLKSSLEAVLYCNGTWFVMLHKLLWSIGSNGQDFAYTIVCISCLSKLGEIYESGQSFW